MILFLSAILQETDKILPKLQQYTKLIEVLIWPITVITGLLIFRKQINKIRVKSFKVDKTGTVEVNLFDKQLEKAENENFLYLPGKPSAKSGGNIKPKGSQAKSTHQKRSHAESTYQGLLELDSIMNQKLIKLANEKEIDIISNTNFALVSQLSDANSIDSKTASQLKSVIELIRIGSSVPNLTQKQVEKTKDLFNNIRL